MVALAKSVGDVAGRLAELGQVLPDAEATAGTGQDDRADLRIAGVLQRRPERLVHLAVERVQDVGTVQRDREDAAVPRCLDLGHWCNLGASAAHTARWSPLAFAVGSLPRVGGA